MPLYRSDFLLDWECKDGCYTVAAPEGCVATPFGKCGQICSLHSPEEQKASVSLGTNLSGSLSGEYYIPS